MTDSVRSTKQDHYLVLDAARGLAALAVMLYHVQKYIYPQLGGVSFLHHSYLAVDLFFLMSGLVIARAYEAKLLAGSMSFAQFCRVRFIRLYPLYFAGLMLGLAYAIIKTILKPEEAITFTQGAVSFGLNAAFLPDVVMSRSDIFPFNPAAWSLALEWAINILYAIWAVRQSNARLLVITALAGAALVPVAVNYGSVDMGWGLVRAWAACCASASHSR